jgi:hypothetical protein
MTPYIIVPKETRNPIHPTNIINGLMNIIDVTLSLLPKDSGINCNEHTMNAINETTDIIMFFFLIEPIVMTHANTSNIT